MVHLVSQEGESFDVALDVAIQSELVKTMIDEEQDEAEVQEIPLPNVKSAVLAKIIEFCKLIKEEAMNEIEKPLKSTNMQDVVQQRYADFIAVEHELLFEMVLAANFMDIKPLLDLSCAAVASLVKGKSTEEIRKTFNINNEYTPADEAQVRAENKWCEEA